MKTSSYLEQTLSFEQSPATDQYFEARASHLFELPGGSSCLELHVQRPFQDQSSDRRNPVQESDLKQDLECNSEPPSPVDWHRYPREYPPHYVAGLGLEKQEVSNVEDLKKIANVRRLMVVIGMHADLALEGKASKNCFRIWYVL